MIAIKSQPARRANFEGDYPLLIPRVNSPRFQVELDQWYFDFKTVLMRQRTELYDFVNDEINQLDEAQADIVVVEDDVEEIQGEITIINNHLTQIDNSITNINTQLITVTHIVTTFVLNAATGDGIVQSNGTGNPQSSILGSPGYFTYWRASDPYLAANSPLYTDGTNVGIATTTPGVLFDLGLAGTTAGVMRLAGSTSGNVTINTAAAAGAWTLTLPTTDGAANEFLKTNGTGVTSWSSVVLTTDVTGLLPTANGGTNHGLWTAGSVIFAGAGGLLLTEDNANLFWDDANNRLGVGMSTPAATLNVSATSRWDDSTVTALMISSNIVGETAKNLRLGFDSFTTNDFGYIQAAETAVGTKNLVLQAQGGNTGVGLIAPLSKLHVAINDAVATVTDVLRLNHSLTGGTAANFGTGVLITGKTSTTDAQDMARIQTIWTDSTHATRTSALQFQTVNSAAALATGLALSGNGQVSCGLVGAVTLSTAALYGIIKTAPTSVNNATGAAYGSLVCGLISGLRTTGAFEFSQSYGGYFSINNQNTSVSNYARCLSIYAGNETATSRAFEVVGAVVICESNSTAGTISAVKGIEITCNNNTAGQTFTSSYGIKINNIANAGTITNTYGVHVGDITTGTQSNVPYSFISTDANARQSFAGNTGMGGGLSVGDGGTTMTLGVVNATVGYRIANAAASGAYLRGNGTNFIGSALLPSDITYAFTEGSVLFAGPGGTTISQDNTAFFWDNTNNFLGLGTAVPLVLLHLNTAGFNDTSILFENANGYAAIELDGPTGDFKVSSLFGELQFVAGNQVHLSMDGVGNTLVVSGLGTISGYFSATGNVGIGTNATAPGALLDIGLAGTTLGVMRLAGSTSGNVTIQAQAIAGTWTLQLPIDDGAIGSILTSNGSGVSAWTTVLPIANGGTNANAFGTTEGVVYFDGTRLVNSADLFYSGSELVSRGVSLNGINEPYAARNINTGANAGTGYEAEVADTSNNLITAGYITWFKEQSWTTVAATQDSSATIGTTLNGATIAAILLHSSGSVVCGKNATSNTRIDDFLYIPSSAGNPSGVAEEYGSRCPLAYDTTNNELFVYNVTDNTWRSVVLT